MALTKNPDGTATYAATVPAPITVTANTDGSYTAGSCVFTPVNDTPANRRQHAAELIAISDAIDADIAARQAAAALRLAQALYANDTESNPNAATWPNLDQTTRNTYISRAESLGALGVTAANA